MGFTIDTESIGNRSESIRHTKPSTFFTWGSRSTCSWSFHIYPEGHNLLTTSIVISPEVFNILTMIVFDFVKERSFQKFVIF